MPRTPQCRSTSLAVDLSVQPFRFAGNDARCRREIGRGVCLALIARTGICWGLHHATSRWSPLSWPLDLLHASILSTPSRRAYLPSDVVVSTARQCVVACARATCPLFCELSSSTPTAVGHPEHQHLRRSARHASVLHAGLSPTHTTTCDITCTSRVPPLHRGIGAVGLRLHIRRLEGLPIPDAPPSPHHSRTT
jgi:hypothetical protein